MIEQFHSRIAKFNQSGLLPRSTKAKRNEALERRRMALSVLTLVSALYVGAVLTGDGGFQVESINLQRLF